jgi:phosphohistidine swiveling domain-containing protein
VDVDEMAEETKPTAADRPADAYSNRLAQQMLPGLVTPLQWSETTPRVLGACARLMAEAVGGPAIEPGRLMRLFWYHPYINTTVVGQVMVRLGLPADALDVMMGAGSRAWGRMSPRLTPQLLRLLPRLAVFLYDKVYVESRLAGFCSRTLARLREARPSDVTNAGEAAVLAELDCLGQVYGEIMYYGIVAGLSMYAYNWLLKGQLAKVGVSFADFDVTADLPELREFDPRGDLAHLGQLVADLPPPWRERLAGASYAALGDEPGLATFRSELELFLAKFGHLSDSGTRLDSKPWREEPEVLLRLLANPGSPAGTLPARWRYEDLRLGPWRRFLLGRVYRRARRFRLLREQASHLIGLAVVTLRDLWLALADSFVRRGLLSEREDIFLLYGEEVRRAVTLGAAAESLQEFVAVRRREMAAARTMALPAEISGDQSNAALAVAADKYRGVPAAGGRYSGRTRTVRGLGEQADFRPGEVLIIEASDASWTPLLARAGAIVAEAGGMLSHCAIVAREYGVPAVVGVAGACQIPAGTSVLVDGDKGEVLVLEPAPASTSPAVGRPPGGMNP